MRRWAIGLALLAAACGDAMTEKPPATAGTPPPAGDATIPAGAIPVEDGMYMVPAGMLDGCPSFRPFAPGRMVAQVIYFRKAGGGFTPNRAEADCTVR